MSDREDVAGDLAIIAAERGHAALASSILGLLGGMAWRWTLREAGRQGRGVGMNAPRIHPAINEDFARMAQAHSPELVLEVCTQWLQDYTTRGAAARTVENAGRMYLIRLRMNGAMAELHGAGWIRGQLTFHNLLRGQAHTAEVLSVEADVTSTEGEI